MPGTIGYKTPKNSPECVNGVVGGHRGWRFALSGPCNTASQTCKTSDLIVPLLFPLVQIVGYRECPVGCSASLEVTSSSGSYGMPRQTSASKGDAASFSSLRGARAWARQSQGAMFQLGGLRVGHAGNLARACTCKAWKPSARLGSADLGA